MIPSDKGGKRQRPIGNDSKGQRRRRRVRCINDPLLGYSIGLVARVHKFAYKSHRSSSEVTARINFALAATRTAPVRGEQHEDERHAPDLAHVRTSTPARRGVTRKLKEVEIALGISGPPLSGLIDHDLRSRSIRRAA